MAYHIPYGGHNQQILMQLSLLDLEMNDTCDSMNFTQLT